jgi:hypothetical protein
MYVFGDMQLAETPIIVGLFAIGVFVYFLILKDYLSLFILSETECGKQIWSLSSSLRILKMQRPLVQEEMIEGLRQQLIYSFSWIDQKERIIPNHVIDLIPNPSSPKATDGIANVNISNVINRSSEALTMCCHGSFPVLGESDQLADVRVR